MFKHCAICLGALLSATRFLLKNIKQRNTERPSVRSENTIMSVTVIQ